MDRRFSDLSQMRGIRVDPKTSTVRVLPGYYASYYGFYGASYGFAASPGYAFNYVETQLEATLYDVKSGKLVWAGAETITDESSDEKNMKRVIKAVIADLQKNGLLPNPK